MKAYQADIAKFEANDTQVFGLSVDSPFANAEFAKQNGVTFPILSDFAKRSVVKAYGIYNEDGGYGNRATFVIDKINGGRSRYKLSDYAVLFRTNAQSRPFEEELLRGNIPYSVVGGVKFYERAEIKDVLSFLRLAIRPHDTPSIERVINVPSRGIGDTTTKALNDQAAAQNVTLWTVIEGDLHFLPPRASKAVKEFREIVHDLQRASSHPLPELYDYLLLRTGYRRMLQESRDVQDESRLQNIDEMMNSAREYSEQNPGATLGDYLDSLTLMSDLDKYESQKGVTLMTLHAAKGLEFKVVFLTGMEEGILPHSQSKESNEDLEEERRLCYVGMTRAREQLWCVHCLERRLHGQFREQSPSPFITEIPEGVREEVRMARARYVPETPSWRERPVGQYDRYSGEPRRQPSYARPSAPPPRAAAPPPPPQPRKNDSVNGVLSFFKESPVQLDPAALRPATPPGAPAVLKRGQRVRHEQFGDGTILTMEGSGPEAKLTVYFDRLGSKKFIAKYAKLMRI